MLDPINLTTTTYTPSTSTKWIPCWFWIWLRLSIIGDSILKMISPHTLKQKLNQIPWSATRWHDHYVQPTIIKQCTILHAGTNDITNNLPKTIMDKSWQIGKQITEGIPKTKLAISQIITRADEPNLATKVSEVNWSLQIYELGNYFTW